jgi:hypothetical protein
MGRVREQVTDGGPLRPGGLVEIERALLGGDEDCVRGQELRHRAPAELVLDVAVCREHPVCPRDAGRRVLGSPALDPLQRVHGGRW